jgi:hypothetical protein
MIAPLATIIVTPTSIGIVGAETEAAKLMT